jgi:hypothetical protein
VAYIVKPQNNHNRNVIFEKITTANNKYTETRQKEYANRCTMQEHSDIYDGAA